MEKQSFLALIDTYGYAREDILKIFNDMVLRAGKGEASAAEYLVKLMAAHNDAQLEKLYNYAVTQFAAYTNAARQAVK